MSETVWWCIAALLLQSCRAFPTTGNRITCHDFGSGVTFDPRFALGNWTTVYHWSDNKTHNATETLTISEMTPAQLEEYHDIVKDYKDDNTLKLVLKISTVEAAAFIETAVGLIVTHPTGETNAWIIHLERNNRDITSRQLVPFAMRLKRADEFLVLMVCLNKSIFLLSKTSPVDQAKMERVAADLRIGGDGGKIYPYNYIS